MDARGIVVTPKFETDGRALYFPGSPNIDAVSLRQYLLYWDKLEPL